MATDKEIIEAAIEAGKQKSQIIIADFVASKAGLTRNQSLEKLDALVIEGKLYVSGSGSRNTLDDQSGKSDAVMWYGEWPE